MEGIDYFGCGVAGVERKVGGLCSLRSHHNFDRAPAIENGDRGEGGEIGREGEMGRGGEREREGEGEGERRILHEKT